MSKLFRFLYTLIFATTGVSCGVQTSVSDSSALVVTKEKKVVSSEPTKLSITAGSAKGAEVTLPAGALPEDSKLVLDRVSQPETFRGLVDSEGTRVKNASSPISVTAFSADGSAINKLVRPMKISIPVNLKTAALFALEGVEATQDNLCVLLTTEVGNYVWRRSSITLDETEKIAKLSSLNLGVFQAFFCGQRKLEGFIEAEEVGVIEGSSSLKLSIDSAKYGYGGQTYCLLLGSRAKSTSNSFSEVRVAKSASYSISGGEVVMQLDFLMSYLGDEQQGLLGLMILGAEQECTFAAGDIIKQKPNYLRAFFLYVTKEELTSNQYDGTFGVGKYQVYNHKIDYGFPLSEASSQKKPTKNYKLCVGDENPSIGYAEVNSELTTDGKLSGGDLLSVDFWRPRDNIQVFFGDGGCQRESFASYSVTNTEFAIDMRKHRDKTFYMEFATFNEKTLSTRSTSVGCLEIFDGNVLSGTATSIPNKEGKILSRWVVTQGQALDIMLSWDNSKMDTNQKPVYDFLFSINSACNPSAEGGAATEVTIPIDDKAMSAVLSF